MSGAPGQLDLLGGSDAAGPTHSLFLALLPDAATRDAMARVASSLRSRPGTARARWIEPLRYHATLHFLGEHAELRGDLVAAVHAAAGSLCTAPFAWTLDRLDSFRGPQSPWILQGTEQSEPLRQCWQRLQHALVLAGLGKSLARQFTPHVTLAYARDALPAEAIAPIEWRVDGYALLHGVSGRGGGYEVLGRWAFEGA